MSDEPINTPENDRQVAVDAVIAAVTANRGTPALVTTPSRPPNMTYTAKTGQVTYASDEDRQIAEARGVEVDTLDDHAMEANLKQLAERAKVAASKLEESSFDARTGQKVYKLPLGSEERRVQEQVAKQALESLQYQHGTYQRALDARETRDVAASQGSDAAAIGQAWTGGDPSKQSALDRALVEVEARHIAETMIRAKLGILG